MALANSSMIRTGGVITRVAAGAGLAVAGMGILSLRSAGNFQESMNILQAVSGATTEEFKALHDEAIALGRDMKLPNVSAKDAAEAMQELSKAGLDVNDTLAATRGTLQFGIAAGIGFADSANIVARSLTAFGLSGEHATEVADLFTAAANKSTASATDIALGFQMASAQFKAGDQTIQGLTTSLTLMANAGVVGSDAGTSLKTMMNRLMAPTKKAKDLMHDLGFKVYDASGNMKSMPDIISSLSGSLKGMSKEQKNAALYTIFGSDAIRAARIQLDAGAEGWRKMEEKITKGGEAQRFAEARTKGFNGAVQALFSAVETLAIELGEHMLPAAEKVARAMANFVNSIDPDKIAAVFGVIEDGVTWIYNLIDGSEILKGVLIGVAAGFAAFFIITSIVGMVTGLAGAFGALTTLLLANPIVLIAAALIGLGIGLVYAYKKSEEFRAIVDGVFSWLKENVLPIVMDIVNGIRNNWDDIVDIFKTVGQLIVFWWNNTWGRILNFVIDNWGKIKSVISAVLSNIMIEIRGVLKTIEGIINVVMGVIQGDWGRAWKGIKQIVDGTLGTIAALIKNTLTRLVPAVLGLALAIGVAILKGIGKGILNLAGWLYDKMYNGITGAITTVVAWVGGAAAAIGKAILDGILSGVTGLARKLGEKIGNAAKSAFGFAKKAIGAGSPSKLAADEVGAPIGEGIIMGFLTGVADLPTKMSEKLKAALEAGKKIVEGYQTKFKEAFEGMVSNALEAFDRITAGYKTMGERALAAFDLKQARIQAQKEMDALVLAVTEARDKLDTFLAQGPPVVTREEGESESDFLQRQVDAQQKYNEDLAALNQTYAEAQDAVTAELEARRLEKKRAALEAQAAKERQNYEDRRAEQRGHLEKELQQLQTFLLEHPKAWNKTQKSIIKLLDDYGIKYQKSGTAVGMAFARGLEASYGEIMQRARAIAQAVADVLQTGSPTKTGPMSTLDHWWDSFGRTLVSGLDTGPIRNAALGIAGIPAGGAAGGFALGQSGATAGTGSATYVNVNVQGSLIAEQDLNDRIREAVTVEDRRGRTIL